jgi:hypothetical protein
MSGVAYITNNLFDPLMKVNSEGQPLRGWFCRRRDADATVWTRRVTGR